FVAHHPRSSPLLRLQPKELSPDGRGTVTEIDLGQGRDGLHAQPKVLPTISPHQQFARRSPISRWCIRLTEKPPTPTPCLSGLSETTMKVFYADLGADPPKAGKALEFQAASHCMTRVTDGPRRAGGKGARFLRYRYASQLIA